MALQNIEANITLDLYNHDTTPATVKAIQLDSQTRYVAARLQNVGVQYDVDSGATVQLIVVRPDKVGVQITGETFTYGDEGAQFLGPYAELTQAALAVNGKMRGQFKITSGTQILRTEIFAISNGEALDASTDEWADEYDGYNLEEMATSIETNTADIATLEADVSQIKEDLEDIVNSAYVTDSASGSVAHFVDGADDVPMKSVKVNIEPVQGGSGDPSPSNVRPISGWDSVKVTRTGKNLFSFGNISAKNIYRANVQQMGTDPNAFYLAGAMGNYNNMQLLVNTWSYVCIWINYKTTAETTITVSCKVKNYSADCNGFVRIRYGDTQTKAGSTSAAATNFNDVGQYQVTVTATIPSGKYVGLEFSPAAKGSEFTLTQYTEITEFQLELSSTATPYEPYNGTTLPISWQSEAGTVYGGKLDVLSGKLTVYPYYASYNGETLTGEWISDRDVYAEGTTPTIGAQVVDMSGTGTEVQLEANEIASLLGANNLWADTGDVAVEYRADTKLYIERLTAPDSADMITDSNIVSGQYFMVGNNLYKATANIASGASVIVGTNAIRKSLSEALNEINA